MQNKRMNKIINALILLSLITVFCTNDRCKTNGENATAKPKPEQTSAEEKKRTNGSRLSDQQVRHILQLHNQARAEVRVAPLTWSADLAAYAQLWADHLAAYKCNIEHRPETGKFKQKFGENLFMGTANAYEVQDAVRSWLDEKSAYPGGALRPSTWQEAGHYTQVVWKNTTQVGCAEALCNGVRIVVCNYAPPGNVAGESAY